MATCDSLGLLWLIRVRSTWPWQSGLSKLAGLGAPFRLDGGPWISDGGLWGLGCKGYGVSHTCSL